MKLNKKVCKSCLYLDSKSESGEFPEVNLNDDRVYCPAKCVRKFEGREYIHLRFGLPDDCPYKLEQMVMNEKIG